MRMHALLCTLLLATSSAWAGMLELANGALIPGKLKGIDTEQVIWDAELIGEIKVDASAIARLEAVAPPDLRVGKVSIDPGCPITTQAQSWSFDCAERDPLVAAWHDIGHVERMRDGSGKITTSLTLERGNSSTDEYEVDMAAQWRRDRYRHVVSASLDQEQKRGETTDDEADLDYQLDYLFDANRYVYGRTEYNRDRFSTTQESMLLGAGLGREWRPSNTTTLLLQGGPQWGWFDLQSYGRFREWGGGIHWQAHHETRLWKFDITLFHDGDFAWLLRDSDLNRLRTKSGIELPLLRGVIAEIRLDYDRTGVNLPEVDNTDIEWVFSLGYRW